MLFLDIIACNCSSSGSNLDRASDCDRLNGACFCKEFVIGRTCDECKDEFWNLQTGNPTGCQGLLKRFPNNLLVMFSLNKKMLAGISLEQGQVLILVHPRS